MADQMEVDYDEDRSASNPGSDHEDESLAEDDSEVLARRALAASALNIYKSRVRFVFNSNVVKQAGLPWTPQQIAHAKSNDTNTSSGAQKRKFENDSAASASAGATAHAAGSFKKQKLAGGRPSKREDDDGNSSAAGETTERESRFMGPLSVYPRLRMPRTATGGAVLTSTNAIPPIGTFVNVSEGILSMTPETIQYPYTGSLLKKPTSGALPAANQAEATLAGAAGSSTANPTLSSSKGPLPVVMPSHAAWFDLAQVHEIERACLPEFFDGTSLLKGKKSYRETRNFIVNTFRQNPRIYLSLTAIRRSVIGDATSLQRIHTFLENWGIINYHVDAGSAPCMTSPGNFNSTYPLLTFSAYGGFQPLINVRESRDVLQHLIHHRAHPGGDQHLRRSVVQGVSNTLSNQPLQLEYATRHNVNNPLTCRSCSSTSVENVRYICRQKRDFFLCTDCFFNGRYPHVMTSQDFERYLSDEIANAYDAERHAEWSREEVFRLLQGLSAHGDDWDSVAEHVGKRSRDECCLKFIQLPIEEPFLEQYYNQLKSKSNQPNAYNIGVGAANSNASLNPAAALAGIPFAESPNPVLAQVAFLAAHISPSVAAAGAQAALAFSAIQEMNGQEVLTPFGPGTIVVPSMNPAANVTLSVGGVKETFSHSSFTRPDGILTVQLPWAKLYAHASQIRIDPSAAANNANANPALKKEDAAAAAASAKPEKPKKEPVWSKDVVSLSAHVLQSAARKSVELAEEEERKVLRLVAQLTGTLMKRIETKLTHLDELEAWAVSQRTIYDTATNSYLNQRVAEAQAQQAALQAQQAQAQAAAAAAAGNSMLSATHAHLQHQQPHADANPFRAY